MSEPTENLPALGRLLGLVERHFFKLLLLAALGVLIAGFLIDMHPKNRAESFRGFYAAFGFVSLTVLLGAVTVLKALVGRPEDYYGNLSTNGEPYPADQLEVRDHDV